MPLSPTTGLGRYEIRALLGAGGMGEVYRAWDHDLEREVAIKVLREGGGERRFIQEAKAASGLHHPNIAHVYEIGTHEELRFIVASNLAQRSESVDDVTCRSAKFLDQMMGPV